MVPAVAVLKEYEYVTLVALTWLFVTVQLTFVSVPAACAADVPKESIPPTSAHTTIRARRGLVPIRSSGHHANPRPGLKRTSGQRLNASFGQASIWLYSFGSR